MACAFVVGLVLAGCGTTPPRSTAAPPAGRDGPLPNPPADLDSVPDAEPRVEPIRPGGANKPYEVEGQRYEPETRDVPLRQRGLASWYGRKFHGRPTASGEIYNMYAMTAAHATMPLPSYARVRNPANGREIIVRVNDRGPFHPSRVIDLSYTAALKLGLLRGVGIVEVERITNEDIRSAAWRRGGDVAVAAAAPAPAPAPAPPAQAPAAAASAPPMATVAAAGPTASQPGVDAAQATDAAAASPATDVPPSTPVSSTLPAATAAAQGYWVQLGAFRQRQGALSFQQRVAAELDWIAPLLAVFNDSSVNRLQAGPYASREEASGVAERLRVQLKLVPVIIERR